MYVSIIEDSPTIFSLIRRWEIGKEEYPDIQEEKCYDSHGYGEVVDG